MKKIYFLSLVLLNIALADTLSWCNSSNLNKTEHTICANDELSKLDKKLAKVYGLAKASSQSQKEWVAQRDKCGNDIECIKNSYTSRIKELENQNKTSILRNYAKKVNLQTKVWQKTYGGSDSSDIDNAFAIAPTKDGGFIVAGSTDSFGSGSFDVYLIKIDNDGNKIWQKTYGGSDRDDAFAITPTKDGGFIVAGSTNSFGSGSFDVYLIKIDNDGNKIWQKTYGGSDSDEAYAITPTKDGGFIVAGRTFSFGNGKEDVYLIKIDNNGNKIWQKTYGGSDDDEVDAITPTNNDGFIVAGYTGPFGKEDVYLIKIDNNGNKIWQKTYGGNYDDYAHAIAPTKDGGFIVAGRTFSFGSGMFDVYLIKIDNNGNKVWQKTYGGSDDDGAYAITPTNDDGFIVAGKTESFGNGEKDVYLIKIDNDGNKIWQKTYGGSNDEDEVDAITPTKDGGFIVAGRTFSFGNGKGDVYLIKIDNNGKSSSEKNLKIAPKEENSPSLSTSSEKKISINIKNCNSNYNGTTCVVYINGSLKEEIGYIYKNNYPKHYDIYYKNGGGEYYPDLNQLYTPPCNRKYNVSGISSAMYYMVKCYEIGHY